MLILGVETSCDDTAAAVLRDGRTVLANIVSSEDHVHSPYGGVVPELASRQHSEIFFLSSMAPYGKPVSRCKTLTGWR